MLRRKVGDAADGGACRAPPRPTDPIADPTGAHTPATSPLALNHIIRPRRFAAAAIQHSPERRAIRAHRPLGEDRPGKTLTRLVPRADPQVKRPTGTSSVAGSRKGRPWSALRGPGPRRAGAVYGGAGAARTRTTKKCATGI